MAAIDPNPLPGKLEIGSIVGASGRLLKLDNPPPLECDELPSHSEIFSID
jgi:hypothetical protein